MSNLIIFTAGFCVLMIVSLCQPMRGWLHDLLAQRYLLLFFIPILILFGWPIENYEFYREGSDLGWKRVARIILFTGFFCLAVFSILYRRYFIFPSSSIFYIFALYILLAAASALYSPEPMQSLWKAFELLVILVFALGLYERHLAQPEQIVGTTNALQYIAFSLCLMSLVGGGLAPEIAWRDFGFDGVGMRSMSGVAPMINPNMLGQIGGMVALVGLARLLILKCSRRKGDWLVFVVGILTLFLAYSRTSLIAFSLLLILLLFLVRRYDLLLFSLPVFLLLAVFFQSVVLEYLARGQSVEHFTSLSGRTLMWEAALDAWSRNPLLGHGFFVGHKYVELGSDKFLATTDNAYVETLVNLGVVGFLLIVAFAVGALRLSLRVFTRCYKTNRAMLPTAIILLIFVSFIIFRSLTGSSFQVLHYNLLFLMVAIVSLHIIERQTSTRIRDINHL